MAKVRSIWLVQKDGGDRSSLPRPWNGVPAKAALSCELPFSHSCVSCFPPPGGAFAILRASGVGYYITHHPDKLRTVNRVFQMRVFQILRPVSPFFASEVYTVACMTARSYSPQLANRRFRGTALQEIAPGECSEPWLGSVRSSHPRQNDILLFSEASRSSTYLRMRMHPGLLPSLYFFNYHAGLSPSSPFSYGIEPPASSPACAGGSYFLYLRALCVLAWQGFRCQSCMYLQGAFITPTCS